ncbi:MAG: hypothetical protein AAFZ58_17130 [Pseudomonadota bacterium]
MFRPRLTGIWVSAEPKPSVAREDFDASCYLAAQIVGGCVDGVFEQRPTDSFFRVRITASGETRDVLCNTRLPIVAFAEPLTDGRPPVFVSSAELQSAFAAMGYVIYRADNPARPLTAADRETLERWQVATHRFRGAASSVESLIRWWD